MTATKIEWTDEVWNPVTGCDRVSPGCDNCYAERIAKRFGRPFLGAVELHPDRLDAPLKWRKPRRAFVNSVSDLFHPDVPSEFIAEVFAVMALAEQHTFQVLTKRPQRMAKLLSHDAFIDEIDTCRLRRDPLSFRLCDFPRPNVWLGVSVENQRYADLRIPHLLATPAAVRFLSVEPLLGPVDLSRWLAVPTVHAPGICVGRAAPVALIGEIARALSERVDWVIVGGESGPGARPMHPRWARDVRDQCVDAGVPFFFKQWGEYVPARGHREFMDLPARQRAWVKVDGEDGALVRVGKKAAGRELDGREWNEYPE